MQSKRVRLSGHDTKRKPRHLTRLSFASSSRPVVAGRVAFPAQTLSRSRGCGVHQSDLGRPGGKPTEARPVRLSVRRKRSRVSAVDTDGESEISVTVDASRSCRACRIPGADALTVEGVRGSPERSGTAWRQADTSEGYACKS